MTLPRLTAIACLVSLSFLPAVAADAGVFGGVDAVALRPAGASPDYVVVDPDADLDLEGEVRSVELSSEIVPRLTVGWRWQSRWNTPAEIALSLWSFDADETESNASGAGSLWDVLSPPNLALGAYDGSTSATFGIESRAIDLSFAQTVLADDRAGVRVRIGLRQLRHETTVSANYAGAARSVDVATVSEAEAFGVRAGAEGVLPLSSRVSLEGELAYGLLRGTVETRYTASSLAAFPAIDLSIDRDRNVTTLDGAIRLKVDVWRSLSLRAAVEWARWTDVVDTLTFLDDVQQASFVVNTDDAVWQGVSVGAGWSW